MSHTVAIVGASGLLGRNLVRPFLAHKDYSNVTLLTRKGGAGKLAEFASEGAKVVEVDFTSQAELTSALTGVDVVVSAVGMEGLLGQVDVIKAAKAAGVRRFVPSEYSLDSTAPGIREAFPQLGYKFAVQDAVYASGLEYTLVMTGGFVETTFTPYFSWNLDEGKVTLKGNTDAPLTITSIVDIGLWLPDLLLDPASKNATVYLKGEEVTFDKAVDIISQATGKKLEVTRKSVAELDGDIAAAPEPFAAFGDLLLRAISEGRANVTEAQKWNKSGPTVTIAKHFAAQK